MTPERARCCCRRPPCAGTPGVALLARPVAAGPRVSLGCMPSASSRLARAGGRGERLARRQWRLAWRWIDLRELVVLPMSRGGWGSSREEQARSMRVRVDEEFDFPWGGLSLTSRLGGARRPQRGNVAVGAPPGDRRVRILHRAPRRLRLPECHLRAHTATSGTHTARR